MQGNSYTLFEYLELNYDIKPSIEKRKESHNSHFFKKEFMTKSSQKLNFLLAKRFQLYICDDLCIKQLNLNQNLIGIVFLLEKDL